MRRRIICLLLVVIPIALIPLLFRLRSWRPTKINYFTTVWPDNLEAQSIRIKSDEIQLCCAASSPNEPLGASVPWSSSVRNWDGQYFRVTAATFDTFTSGILTPDGQGLLIDPMSNAKGAVYPDWLFWDFTKMRFTWGWPARKDADLSRFKHYSSAFIQSYPSAATCSPDGRVFAAVELVSNAATPADQVKTIRLLDIAGGRLLAQRPPPFPFTMGSMAYTPDGSTLLMAESNGRIVELSAKDLRVTKQWRTSRGYGADPNAPTDAALVSAKGWFLLLTKKSDFAASGPESCLQLWGMRDHHLHGSLFRSPNGITQAAFSPDDSLLAVSEDNGKVTILRVPDMTLFRVLPETAPAGPGSPGDLIGWTRDGRTLIRANRFGASLQRLR